MENVRGKGTVSYPQRLLVCLKHLKKVGVTGTQHAGGRVTGEVGGAARNHVCKALGKCNFTSKFNGKPLRGLQ